MTGRESINGPIFIAFISPLSVWGRNVGDIPGTGLGLAVVNTGVELHRGTGAMESIEGQGTTV
jgi:signal transduction histidine kinase